MIQDSNAVIDVDDFLAEHRRKINEDKRVLSDIFNFLQEKEKQQDNDYQQDDGLNKLDKKSIDFQENNPFSAQDLYKDDNRRVMVRYGEFSPLNPVFRCSGKPLIGLGEYEERRKIFLEKKKQEYLQYLLKAKNDKEREKSKLKVSEAVKENENLGCSNANVSTRTQNMPREIFSPGRGLIEDTDRCFARWQQQAYRNELDRQISDKRRRLKEEKQREKEECEKKKKEAVIEQMKIYKLMTDRIKLYQNFENQFDTSSVSKDSREKENQSTFHQNGIVDDDRNQNSSVEDQPVPKPDSNQSASSTSPSFNTASTRLFRAENLLNRVSSPLFNITPNHSQDIHRENQSKPFVSPVFNIAADHSRDIDLPNPSKPFKSPLFVSVSDHSRDVGLPTPTKPFISPLFNTASDHSRNIEFPTSSKPRINSLFNTAPDHSIDIRTPRTNYTSSSFFNDTSNRETNCPSQNNSPTKAPEEAVKSEEPVPESSEEPIPKQPASVEDPEAYLKEQRERYKQELEKQIEEKLRLKMERQKKEEEEEKKIEQKAKAAEEKLRKEFEKEQEERAFRAAQKVQQQVRLQDHLRKIQIETEERKKAARKASVAKSSKQTVFSTNHGVTNKGAMKNVSFAPNTYVHSAPKANHCLQSNEISSTENRKSDSGVLVEAPYKLAVKGNDITNNNTSGQEHFERPLSPPVPAIRTKKLLNSLSKNDDIIPSTVSMSRETKEKFLKDSEILSNLSEMRRKLLENRTDLGTE